MVPHSWSSATGWARPLDFTEAAIAHPRCGIELDVTGRLGESCCCPATASVDTDDLRRARRRGLKDKVGRGRPGPGGTHFVLAGTVRAGSRSRSDRPTYVRIGALVIRFPWKITWDRD